MSSSSSELSSNASTNSFSSREESEEEADYAVVTSNCVAYAEEPLADPAGEDIINDELDEDGLSPLTLEMRSESRIPLNEWCNCKNCHVQLLAGVMEYRCCKEMTPALRILTFDGSIERVDCITQHDDFGAMINPTVLEQVGPFFKDRNGRSYRRRGGQSRNDFLRAVAYRWLIKWMCGLLGWENTRPLPACVYHKIRTVFQTNEARGYIPAHKRA